MSKKLTNEEIIENRQTFHKICKMYNVCNDDFLLFLDSTDFYYAPLMPMKSGVNVFSGGLVEYIIKVSRYILKINKTLPEQFRVNEESLIKVAIVHNLGRINLFIPNKNNWSVINQGRVYEYNNTLTAFTIPERSLYYIQGFIKLSDAELQAIFNYEKENDKQAEYYSNIITDILKSTIKLTLYILKEEEDGRTE